METVNQGASTAQQEGQGTEKTFTQAEVDSIVKERLGREQTKFADYEELKKKAEAYDAAEEANKSELQKAQEQAAALKRQVDTMTQEKKLREIREKVSKETGVPASMLYGDDEEACKEQAKAILEFKKPTSYPSVKKDKPKTSGGGAGSQAAMRDFAHQLFGEK